MEALMSYADYEYYNNEYLLGKAALISAADFNYYEAKAAGKVDYYTFGRLKTSTDIPEEVKKCVCDIAEKLQEYDKAVKGITSEKVGDYSVSYESKAVQKDNCDNEIKDCIKNYLSHTGLLSRKSALQIGKQCGCIFYVPAAYTSKIDPATGFINIFDFKKYSGSAINAKVKDKKEFLMSMNSIRYVNEGSAEYEKIGHRQLFAFSFDYNNFKTYNVSIPVNEWTTYTYGERIKKLYKDGRWSGSEVLNLTEDLIELMEQYGIEYKDGHDIREDISHMDEMRNADFICNLFEKFKYTVQLRNSKSEAEGDDYDRLVSPVLNSHNGFFDSSDYKENEKSDDIIDDKQIMPKDADANGAYCIALKGLYEINKIKENWSDDKKLKESELYIGVTEWLDYIQNRRFE